MSTGGRSLFRRVGTLVVSVVFAIVSLVWLGATVGKLIIPSDWPKATGQLVSSERDHGGSDRLTTYHRSYSFQAGDMGTYTAESRRYSAGELGSTAPIRYDPVDPARAEVVGFWDRFVLCLTGFGLALLLVGTSLGTVHAIKGLRTRAPS